MSTLIVIPARGGSQGIKKKNIYPLCGQPLIAYTIRFALEEKVKGDIVVTTDDPAIARVAQKYGVEVIHRPKSMAKNTSPLQVAWYHALISKEKEGKHYAYTALLEPTCPIHKEDTLKKALRKIKREKLDSVVTVYEVIKERPEFLKILKNRQLKAYKTTTVQRRQDIRGRLACLDGSLLLIKVATLKKNIHRIQTHGYLGRKVGYILQDFPYTLDIDYLHDAQLAELVLKYWHG